MRGASRVNKGRYSVHAVKAHSALLLRRSSWSGRPPVERESTGSSPVRSAEHPGTVPVTPSGVDQTAGVMHCPARLPESGGLAGPAPVSAYSDAATRGLRESQGRPGIPYGVDAGAAFLRAPGVPLREGPPQRATLTPPPEEPPMPDALTRIRVLRRDGYRCQAREGYVMCGRPASQVGATGDSRLPVSLCAHHLRSCA
jgi:hypothetical protein